LIAGREGYKPADAIIKLSKLMLDKQSHGASSNILSNYLRFNEKETVSARQSIRSDLLEGNDELTMRENTPKRFSGEDDECPTRKQIDTNLYAWRGRQSVLSDLDLDPGSPHPQTQTKITFTDPKGAKLTSSASQLPKLPTSPLDQHHSQQYLTLANLRWLLLT